MENLKIKLLLLFLLTTDNSSIHSDEDNYDDVKSTVASNYQSARSQHYDQYRPAICPGGPSNPVSPSNFNIITSDSNEKKELN